MLSTEKILMVCRNESCSWTHVQLLFLSLISLQIYFLSGVTQEREYIAIFTITIKYNDTISRKFNFF